MKTNAVLVDRVFAVTDELVDVMARLLPQLSTSAVAPDRAALQEIVDSPTSSLFVARVSPGDAIVGSITVLIYRIPTGVHAVIEDVVVDESARGHGVGAALVFEAIELAKRRGARHVNLDFPLFAGGGEPLVPKGWIRYPRYQRLPVEPELTASERPCKTGNDRIRVRGGPISHLRGAPGPSPGHLRRPRPSSSPPPPKSRDRTPPRRSRRSSAPRDRVRSAGVR